jgi:hypothetical protein
MNIWIKFRRNLLLFRIIHSSNTFSIYLFSRPLVLKLMGATEKEWDRCEARSYKNGTITYWSISNIICALGHLRQDSVYALVWCSSLGNINFGQSRGGTNILFWVISNYYLVTLQDRYVVRWIVTLVLCSQLMRFFITIRGAMSKRFGVVPFKGTIAMLVNVAHLLFF